MKRVAFISALGVIALCVVAISQAVLAAGESSRSEKPAVAPADRVVVMYFHRTVRCPTCKRMGSYAEEAVLKGFPKEIKDGTVEFHFVDFQNEKNAALTKGYKVSGPALIVAQVIDNKVKEYKNLTEMWAKSSDKDAFVEYVRENVTAYRKADSKTARR